MPRIEEDPKPEIPECLKCHSRGFGIDLVNTKCHVCRTEESPDKFGIPENLSMVEDFKKKIEELKIMRNSDPAKDKAKDGYMPNYEVPF